MTDVAMVTPDPWLLQHTFGSADRASQWTRVMMKFSFFIKVGPGFVVAAFS
ncbi:MAG: hypothetical protein M3Z24_15705 [Chloroflexota bacterium]|nr:hypothetical protein [Chloroflexota bacterium]